MYIRPYIYITCMYMYVHVTVHGSAIISHNISGLVKQVTLVIHVHNGFVRNLYVLGGGVVMKKLF